MAPGAGLSGQDPGLFQLVRGARDYCFVVAPPVEMQSGHRRRALPQCRSQPKNCPSTRRATGIESRAQTRASHYFLFAGSCSVFDAVRAAGACTLRARHTPDTLRKQYCIQAFPVRRRRNEGAHRPFFSEPSQNTMQDSQQLVAVSQDHKRPGRLVHPRRKTHSRALCLGLSIRHFPATAARQEGMRGLGKGRTQTQTLGCQAGPAISPKMALH